MHSIYEVIAFLLQTTLNFQTTFHYIVEFKKLSELIATLIDIRNPPIFTRKIKKLNKKLLELKKCNFWLIKIRNF